MSDELEKRIAALWVAVNRHEKVDGLYVDTSEGGDHTRAMGVLRACEYLVGNAKINEAWADSVGLAEENRAKDGDCS